VLDDVQLGPLVARASTRTNYVYLAIGRPLRSYAEVASFSADVERYVERSQRMRLLLEGRDRGLVLQGEATTSLWAWIGRSRFERVALVVNDPRSLLRPSQSVLLDRVYVASDLAAAHQWIAAAAPGGSGGVPSWPRRR
jgi:hypothetical protein